MLPVTYFRSSSVKEYEGCALRWFASYCLGLKFPSGPKAILGTVFHEIMEVLANAKMNNEDVDVIDLEILTKQIYDKTVDTVDFSRVPPSYHRKSGERKSIEAWVPFRSLKQSVENVMAMQPRSFDPRKMNVVAVEKKFDIEVKEPWAKYDFTFRGKRYQGNLRLKGSIDLIVANDDGTVSIIDWKSGQSNDLNTGEKKTFESYQDDLQMALYYLVCRRHLGYDVRDATICFLNESICYSLYFDEDLVLEKIRSIFEEMKHCTRPLKNDTLFCQRFCPYSKNTFERITSKPLIRPREYDYVNDEGILERGRTYRMCGQIDLYFRSGCTPLQIMEAIAREDFDIAEYRNV